MIKRTLFFLFIFVLFSQSVSGIDIPKSINSKKLVVIIPDENSKAFVNIMDAVQDYWKYGEFKFMTVKDAESLYGDSNYLFLALVVQIYHPKATEGFFYLTLKRGKSFANKNFSNLPLVYQTERALSDGHSDYYGSIDNIPSSLQKQLYFFTADFINALRYKNGYPPIIKENRSIYTCKKEELVVTKQILSTKKVLLIEASSQQTDRDTLNSEQNIRTFMNNPNLEVLYVDYEEIEMALRKKEPEVMVSRGKKVFSCSDFDDLCVLPACASEIHSLQNKGNGIIIFGVAIFGTIGLLASMSVIMNR